MRRPRMNRPASPVIAIVTPVFNEQAVLPELFARLTALFDAQRDSKWRAILVDDGSRDSSAELIRAQSARDPRFELVELSRNFGFQSALSAGLARASEVDAVVTMDADLQDPPEVIPQLVAAWRDVRAIRDPDAWDAWLHRLTVRACTRLARKERRRDTV